MTPKRIEVSSTESGGKGLLIIDGHKVEMPRCWHRLIALMAIAAKRGAIGVKADDLAGEHTARYVYAAKRLVHETLPDYRDWSVITNKQDGPRVFGMYRIDADPKTITIIRDGIDRLDDWTLRIALGA